MPTLAELTTPRDASELRDDLLARLQAAGLSVTNWTEGGTERTLVEIDATTLAELEVVAADVAKGGLLDEAADAWLTLLAKNKFDVTRRLATFTEHEVVLSDDANTGPHTITPGTTWVATETGLRFVSITGGTLPLGGTLTIEVRAEIAGADYNVGPAAIAVLVSVLAGVTVSNPAIGGTGSSVTVAGSDDETDAALRQRCRDRWAELGSGSTAGAYRNWAIAASSEVTEVIAQDDGSGLGVVEVILAGPDGDVAADVVTAVQAYIDERVPLTVSAEVRSALAAPLTIDAELLGTGVEATMLAAVEERLQDLRRSLGIGDVLYRSAVIATIMNVPGMVNVVLNSPATDATSPGPDEVFEFTFALVWTSV